MSAHALSGRKQSPEHIQKRIEAVAKKRANWTAEDIPSGATALRINLTPNVA